MLKSEFDAQLKNYWWDKFTVGDYGYYGLAKNHEYKYYKHLKGADTYIEISHQEYYEAEKEFAKLVNEYSKQQEEQNG